LLLSPFSEAEGNGANDQSIYEGKQIGELYDRIAADLKQGKPLVVTVYVALCDNDSQGIIPTRNPKICMGDVPEQNLYWASGGGLKGYLTARRLKRVHYEAHETGKLAIEGVWKTRMPTGGLLRERGVEGSATVYIVGLGYRGDRIHDAMADFLKAVSRDEPETMRLPDETVLEMGGSSHIVGYVGHDYFMDVEDLESLMTNARGDSSLPKGVFGLSCASDDYFRPAIQRRNTHILALNTQLTFPSAFTVLGMIRAVAAGENLSGIHRGAALAFAEGQKRSVGAMASVLAYGDKQLAAAPSKPSSLLSVTCRQDWGAGPVVGRYRTQTVRKITIHHQGVEFTKNMDAASRLRTMQGFHESREKGFGDIAYHFVIDPNGKIYEGRPYSAVGETKTDYNPDGHLLICLLGDFEKQTPSDEALESLSRLVAWGIRAFGLSTDAIGTHRDFAHTTCPGANLYKLIQGGALKKMVEKALSMGDVELEYSCARF
jgi:hypothetical protein